MKQLTISMVSKIILNEYKWILDIKFIGEMRLPFLLAISYGIQFAAITAILIHTLLYDGERWNFTV